jgi:hypothetical protein
LRVDAAYRGRLLTARGYRVMRELDGERPVHGSYTTIVDGNAQAEGVLVRRARGAMPRYRFVERLYTLAIPAGGTFSGADSDERAIAGDVPNLYPAYEPAWQRVTVPGGSAALHDQRAWKQTVIDGYDRSLSLVRPLYNMVGRIKLPRPNTALAHAYVTHFRADGAEAAHALIRALRAAAATRGLDHILLGFTESDPFLRVARRFRPVQYTSSIYTVAFRDGDDFHDRLLARPRALDLSAL